MSRNTVVFSALLAAGFAAAATLTSVAATSVAAQPNPAATALPSPGCGTPATASGQSTQQFSTPDAAGVYLQSVPAAAGAGRPLPLVLDLHGYLEPPSLETAYSGIADYGDTHGFVTVTPQTGRSPLPIWDIAGATGATADMKYLSDLITHLESTLCLDQRRVYAAGLSQGGITAMAMACQLSDRVAAVAAVSGLETFPWCHPSRAVPVIAFHGTADPFLAYRGGLGTTTRTAFASVLSQTLPPIPDNAATWARYNGCRPEPTDRRISADVTLRTFECPPEGQVELYTILGGGHTWPGVRPFVATTAAPVVGHTTESISATAIIWDFFRAHALPSTR
jgi:polyhydroxybutyrate depolymerase